MKQDGFSVRTPPHADCALPGGECQLSQAPNQSPTAAKRRRRHPRPAMDNVNLLVFETQLPHRWADSSSGLRGVPCSRKYAGLAQQTKLIVPTRRATRLE